MTKVHIADARAQGFDIDTSCNPPVAYRGPRFQPTKVFFCYTELESELMKAREQLDAFRAFVSDVALESTSDATKEAKALLAKHPRLAAAPVAAVVPQL